MAFVPGPVCGNRDCVCFAVPNPPCESWLGLDKNEGRKHGERYIREDIDTWPYRFCIICGWERKDHKQLIHNGRKP